MKHNGLGRNALDIMKPNQDLFQITTQVLNGLKSILETEKPGIVLVHGDTTTSMAASLACFYLKIPIGHVEAGLRTFDKLYPYPEEMNRVVTDSISTLHFAPTQQSKDNLLKSGVSPKGIYLTGNTVIDALLQTLAKDTGTDLPVQLDPNRRLVLVTVHRRENFGEPLQEICQALLQLVEHHLDIEMVIPVHPNPNVRKFLYEALETHPRIHLIEPQEYLPFCQLMEKSYLILTDSGGVQEEAPSLSKPVLVLRDETERPEAVEMGTVLLVGPHQEKIYQAASRLLSDPVAYREMAHAVNPYGDGLASQRILEALETFKANPFL
ncbi:MAG: UDP-N-acetylglucosamine 2-epimerase (non-hydrolyzing) [Cyanobacteria bacterium]|nr:UDP-N-acetylglucosamine 2-epimerase (non-hydrolyzing) [Cyanobacteriota bacterium]